MKYALLPILAAITFAPVAARAGEHAPRQVAEIVTFHLNDDISDAEFLAAAAATGPFLRQSGHVISRSLSRDENGLWTDYIIWTSQKTALEMAEKAMQHPDFAPFMSMISPNGMSLRHAPVLMRMD